MKKYTVYTDGSFGDDNIAHGGVVYWDNGNTDNCVHVTSKKPEFVSMRNVGGEILAAWSAIMSIANSIKNRNELEMETYELDLIYDYKGVGAWLTHEWKANKAATRWFVKSVEEILASVPNLKVNYIWVKGHSINTGNNVADKVAAWNLSYCTAKNIPMCSLDDVINL